MIKGSGRPLELHFGAVVRPLAPAAVKKLEGLGRQSSGDMAAAAASAASDPVEAVFAEAGPLGLKFTPVQHQVQVGITMVIALVGAITLIAENEDGWGSALVGILILLGEMGLVRLQNQA